MWGQSKSHGTSAVGTFSLQHNVFFVSCAAGGLSPCYSTRAGALDQQVSEQKVQNGTHPSSVLTELTDTSTLFYVEDYNRQHSGH